MDILLALTDLLDVATELVVVDWFVLEAILNVARLVV